MQHLMTHQVMMSGWNSS